MLIDTKTEIDATVARILLDSGIGNKESTLVAKLAENGLSVDECIQQLGDMARNGDPKDTIRLRAVEMGFKLNGVLREAEKPVVPTFTIIINDPGNVNVGINPILIPRNTN